MNEQRSKVNAVTVLAFLMSMLSSSNYSGLMIAISRSPNDIIFSVCYSIFFALSARILLKNYYVIREQQISIYNKELIIKSLLSFFLCGTCFGLKNGYSTSMCVLASVGFTVIGCGILLIESFVALPK